MNEIILSKEGNCYIGDLAQRFATGLSRLPEFFRLDDAEWHVFEVAPDGNVIHRASQSRRNLAEKYMTENRVLVYREGGAPGTLGMHIPATNVFPVPFLIGAGMAFLLTLLLIWLVRDGPATSFFVSGGVESRNAVFSKGYDEVKLSPYIGEPSSGISAPPADNSSDPEWFPNPDRPLHPQLAIYATSEPEKAAEIALSIPCDGEDPEANDPLRTVLKVWAYDDPDMVEAFVNEITDAKRKLGATLGLIEGLAEHDIERATKWVERNIKHPDAVAFISLVVPHMEPKRAESWIASLPLNAEVRSLTQGLVAPGPKILETR